MLIGFAPCKVVYAAIARLALRSDADREMDVANDSVLTIDELAVYLTIPKSPLYKLAQEGKLPGQKVSRH